MMPATDQQLLEQFAAGASDEAFAALVQRHLDLVYSTALRQVRSPQLAEEVAQCVFLDLSKNAARLVQTNVQTLTPWLYQVARRTGIDVVRRESRRQLREQLAVELTDMQNHPSLWSQIEPLLDEAMESLDTLDRDVLLLRFFENKSLREVGASCGSSEDAAQKRVSRALDRLRDHFSKRGVAVGVGSLAALLSTNAVQAAPLGLGAAISAAAAAGAVPTIALAGATKAIAMTTLQKMFATAALTAIGGLTVYQSYRAAHWHDRAQTLEQQQAPLSDQLAQLQRERRETTNRLQALIQENEELRRGSAELPKLRGEVGRLREDRKELAQIKSTNAASSDPGMESTFKTWALRASRLRERLNQAADQRIPELQYLTEKEWFDAVKGLSSLESDEDYKRAFSTARNLAKGQFGHLMQQALKQYVEANNGELPQDLSQLRNYIDKPVDDATFARYKMLQSGKLANISDREYLIGEAAPLVDEDNDATFKFSINGTSSHSGSPTEDAAKEAVIRYAAEHQGLIPTNPAELSPYLQKAVDPVKLQALFGKIPAGVTTLKQLEAVMR